MIIYSATIYFGRFANLDFEHLEWLGRRIGIPTGMSQLGKVDPAQAVHDSCQCSKCKSAERSKSSNIQ
jgi:hypothetical protein